MAYVGVIVVMIVIMAIFGFFIFRFINRKDAARMNRLHRRSLNLRANAERVHEQQAKLREQQRRQ